MSKINVLPKLVQNVIASGQVIDRPASVVKELVENSIDAGARNITIYIKESGLEGIAVVDDGCGIAYEDVKNAFKSYSTSKISKLDDLTEIKTMGFRGEALAAIASISHVNIWTKIANSDLGTKATFIYGAEQYFEYCASGNQGTKIEVTTLYGNVPNKKRFLKRPSTELSEITNVVSRLILANPYIAFKYIVDGNEVLNTMGKGLDEAVFILYGRNCMENCFRVENEFKDVSVTGLVGESSYVKPNSTYQTVVVNGRYVRDDTVAIAVKNAFDGLLMTREYPFFVLEITVPADQLDVNIHPDKMEVKFANKQDVYRAVYAPIKRHFDQEKLLNGVHSVIQKNQISDLTKIADNYPEDHFYPPEEDEYTPGTKNFDNLAQLRFEPIVKSTQKHNEVTSYSIKPNTETEYRINARAVENDFYYKTSENNFSGNKRCNSQTENFQMVDAIPELNEKEMQEISVVDDTGKDSTFSSCKIMGILFRNYLIAENQNKTAVLLIDQHAAHERILYDKYITAINSGPVPTQTLLLPVEFALTAEQIEFLETIKDKLYAYGFEYEITKKDLLSVTGIPNYFVRLDIGFFFNSLFVDHQNNFDIKNINKFYMAKKACKSAIRGGAELTPLDIQFILERLDENKNLRCPHGRPIAIAIKKSAFDRAFKRIL